MSAMRQISSEKMVATSLSKSIFPLLNAHINDERKSRIIEAKAAAVMKARERVVDVGELPDRLGVPVHPSDEERHGYCRIARPAVLVLLVGERKRLVRDHVEALRERVAPLVHRALGQLVRPV
eukprot:751127-Hanusia_phi.AAC.1